MNQFDLFRLNFNFFVMVLRTITKKLGGVAGLRPATKKFKRSYISLKRIFFSNSR